MTVSIILPSASESCARAVRAKSNNRSDNIRFMEKEVSLHRSQILRDLRAMQAVAAEFPGCAENSTAFWRETLCFDSFISKPAQHHIPSQPGSFGRATPDHAGACPYRVECRITRWLRSCMVAYHGRDAHITISARRIKYSVCIERVLRYAGDLPL